MSWYVAGEDTGSLMKAPKEDELDSDRLTEILNMVYKNDNLLRKFDKLKMEKEMEQIIKQMRKGLESLVIDLEGGELIKGYCKLGY